MDSLNDRQQLILRAEIMTKTNNEARAYLKEQGCTISDKTYRRQKLIIHGKDAERMFYLAKNAKERQMQIIDEFKLVKDEYWLIYRTSKNESIRIRTLKQIVEINPYITAAEAAIPYIIKEVIQNFGRSSEKPESKAVTTKS